MYENIDVLIIFDAMRWDDGSQLIKASNLIGDLKQVNTKCRYTQEWYNTYWAEKTDRILITENPMPYHKGTGLAYKNFAEAHKVFGSTWLKVEPQKTFNLFNKIKQPDKKYLLHFLLPHLPFIFGKGAKIKGREKNIYDVTRNYAQRKGWPLVHKYYCEQIENMLLLLQDNLHMFDGYKTILTSDHAEVIDSKLGIYNHPADAVGEMKTFLGQVPFFEINVDETLINKRLAMLGYK